MRQTEAGFWNDEESIGFELSLVVDTNNNLKKKRFL
jgi:hypothetical protein